MSIRDGGDEKNGAFGGLPLREWLRCATTVVKEALTLK